MKQEKQVRRNLLFLCYKTIKIKLRFGMIGYMGINIFPMH